MQFSKIATISALVAAASATDILSASQAPVADDEATVVTTRVTVTGYTTYCPYPTTITITVCEEETFCTESVIVVDEPATITVTEPCVIPTSYAERKTIAPQNVTTYEGAGSKQVAGALAGFAAVAAVMF